MMAPDRFGMLLGIGLITGIIVQAFFNISVVIAMMPTKGIPLPFISYGGSSVVVTLFAVGLLLNISQYAGFIELKRTETENSKVKRRKQK
jgi:cell division protein FtsW